MSHNPIGVLINGAHGKMGLICQQAIQQDLQLELVACCGRKDSLGQQIQEHQPDVIVDLTTPQVVYENALIMIQHQSCPVIGTSGLNPEQMQTLIEQCEQKQLGGLIIPNFSLSAVLMMRYARDAARYFDHIDITERHHLSKKDAPSGTARQTAAEMLCNNPRLKLHQNPMDKQEGIVIHSQRAPLHHAMQDVLCHTPHESLSIKTHCFDHQAYIKGIQLSCHAVVNMKQMKIGLESLLNQL